MNACWTLVLQLQVKDPTVGELVQSERKEREQSKVLLLLYAMYIGLYCSKNTAVLWLDFFFLD